MGINVSFEMDTKIGEVKEELASKVPNILEALGIEAEGNAVTEITIMEAVDTGRLRGSISHAIDGDDVYIGTNVEYGPYVELGTSKMAPRPFLHDAIANYTDDYKAIVESHLKE